MVDTWITLPYGGAGAGFDAQALVQHIQAGGQDYITQGQRKCVLAKHPKPQSLDVWLRTYFTKHKDTAQAVNEVVAQLVATGLFDGGKFPCPDSGHLCKGLRLVNAPEPKSLPVNEPSPSHGPVGGNREMKEVSNEPSSPQKAPGGPSLAELFHLVSRVIPDGQELKTVTPETTVAEALGIMLVKNYSQLPVVQGTAVLGMFSFRSFASRLLTLSDLPQDVGTLPVGEFLEQFHFVQKSDTWESTLEHIDRHDAVLVGHRDGLDAILTSMDVLNYLRGIANPFVMLAEIELSLRTLISGCTEQATLQECIKRSLECKYGSDNLPADLLAMTFDDYVQMITHGENWPYFAAAFGEGDWQRKNTARRLKQVRDLRNTVFHFRRELTDEDHALLAEQREWLQNKTRAFQAKKGASHGPGGPTGDSTKGGHPVEPHGPWLKDGRAWHLTKRCSRKTAEMLQTIQDVIETNFEIDGPHWDKEYYVSYRCGSQNWLTIETRRTQLRLRFLVQAGRFDESILAERLGVQMFSKKESLANKLDLGSSLLLEPKSTKSETIVLRVKDDFEVGSPAFLDFLHSVREAFPW